jgi:hypothetical protein
MSLVSISYDEDDGKECTYYERRAIAKEDEAVDGK